MRCKGCPRKKVCDYDCGECEFGVVFNRLNRKIAKLERQANERRTHES